MNRILRINCKFNKNDLGENFWILCDAVNSQTQLFDCNKIDFSTHQKCGFAVSGEVYELMKYKKDLYETFIHHNLHKLFPKKK